MTSLTTSLISGLFTEIISSLDNIDFGIRAEFIEVFHHAKA